MQRLYNGVRFPMPAPSLLNVDRIDRGARPMLHTMRQRGLQVDLAHFAAMEKVLVEDMDRITEEVRELTGYYVNLDSGKQVSELLFRKLGLKQARVRLTKTGDRESVENEVLVAIQHDHPVVPKILNFKEYSKLKGTYVTPMPRLARRTAQGVWRMFPNLGDTRVPSGRLNCKEPNLLAMPNRTERGQEVCKGFITDENWVYLSIDFSQIEPRVAAHRSGDPTLQAIYHNEEDIYSDFAISSFHLPDTRYRDGEGWHYPGVDKKKHRFPAKTCTLASIYEVTNKGLLEQMPTVCKHCFVESAKHRGSDCATFEPLWNEDNCQDLINAFYIRYSYLIKMRRQDHDRARKHNLLWNEFGRIMHTVATKSVLEWVVSAALREAGNFPIQGTAHDMLKLAYTAVYDDLVEGRMLGDVVHPLLDIHDELLLECRADEAEALATHIVWRFENVCRLDVPVKAGSATAVNWGSLQK